MMPIHFNKLQKKIFYGCIILSLALTAICWHFECNRQAALKKIAPPVRAARLM